MPDRAKVLGFSNRWYPSALQTAQWHAIGTAADDRIRVVDAPHFVATKLESFRSRGHGDFYHHNVEDFLALIDGRAELLDELRQGLQEVRAFVADELKLLLDDDGFREALSGHLPGDKASQARLPILEQRLRAIVASVPNG